MLKTTASEDFKSTFGYFLDHYKRLATLKKNINNYFLQRPQNENDKKVSC